TPLPSTSNATNRWPVPSTSTSRKAPFGISASRRVDQTLPVTLAVSIQRSLSISTPAALARSRPSGVSTARRPSTSRAPASAPRLTPPADHRLGPPPPPPPVGRPPRPRTPPRRQPEPQPPSPHRIPLLRVLKQMQEPQNERPQLLIRPQTHRLHRLHVLAHTV